MGAKSLPIYRRALLTQQDAATYAGVSEDAMRAWMTDPTFPTITKAPLTTPRVVRRAFDRWLETEAEVQGLSRVPCSCTADDPTVPCRVHPTQKELAA